MAKRDDRPLAAASQYLREREREQKAAAKRAAKTPSPPPLSGVEYVAAMRRSVDARTKLLEQIRQQFERIAGNSNLASLRRLADILSLFERGPVFRSKTKG